MFEAVRAEPIVATAVAVDVVQIVRTATIIPVVGVPVVGVVWDVTRIASGRVGRRVGDRLDMRVVGLDNVRS